MLRNLTVSMDQPAIADADLFVAAVEEDAVFLANMVGELSAFTAVPFSSIDELLATRLEHYPVIVIVLGPSQTDENALQRFGELFRSRPGIGGVLVVDGASANVLRLALRAGVDDAIAINKLGEELVGAVRALSQRLASEADRVDSPPEQLPMNPAALGRVTTVFSPKGGAGKSVVAVNLATSLAQRSSDIVVIVDLDLQFGDVAVMLRMQPAHSLAEISRMDQIDAELVNSLLVRDPITRTFVLAAPSEPSLADGVTPATISRLVAVLRTMATHIIIDTPPLLNEVLLQLLDDSDDIILVVGMDIPSVKNARLGLQALEVVGIPLERIVVVLNRADSKFRLEVRDVERTLRMKVNVLLPSEALVVQSVNKGTPALLDHPRSHFAGCVAQLTGIVRARAAVRTTN